MDFQNVFFSCSSKNGSVKKIKMNWYICRRSGIHRYAMGKIMEHFSRKLGDEISKSVMVPVKVCKV